MNIEKFNKVFSDLENINLPLLQTETDNEWGKEGNGYNGTKKEHYDFGDDLVLTLIYYSDSYGDNSGLNAICFSRAKQVYKTVYEKI